MQLNNLTLTQPSMRRNLTQIESIIDHRNFNQPRRFNDTLNRSVPNLYKLRTQPLKIRIIRIAHEDRKIPVPTNGVHNSIPPTRNPSNTPKPPLNLNRSAQPSRKH